MSLYSVTRRNLSYKSIACHSFVVLHLPKRHCAWEFLECGAARPCNAKGGGTETRPNATNQPPGLKAQHSQGQRDRDSLPVASSDVEGYLDAAMMSTGALGMMPSPSNKMPLTLTPSLSDLRPLSTPNPSRQPVFIDPGADCPISRPMM